LDVAGNGGQEEPGPGHQRLGRREDAGLLDENLDGAGGQHPGKRPAFKRNEPFPRAGRQQDMIAAQSGNPAAFVRDQKLKAGFDAEHFGTICDLNRGSGQPLDQAQSPMPHRVHPGSPRLPSAAQVLAARVQVVVQHQHLHAMAAQHVGGGHAGEPAPDDGDIYALTGHR
jgi:hypothetical protein